MEHQGRATIATNIAPRFPGEHQDEHGVEEVDPELLFGGIDQNKSLKTFACPTGEHCCMKYGRARDDGNFPSYPSAEVSGALEALEVYVNDKLQARGAAGEENADEAVVENPVHGDTVSE
ncbi:hypothetical protein AC578_4677 [Pseudocercospora eumusae]|uniref:Uncharacterized protein n=1 Tax=Pseudocercospora eumusae TaxID=321146 RepID=A0A139H7I5_9PEZI|nr:hypothetical protein AC578_4677 [Pseudocercospora eumusae]